MVYDRYVLSSVRQTVLPLADIFGLDTCHAELSYGVAGCMVHVVMTHSCFAVTDGPWHSQQLKQLPTMHVVHAG